MTTYYVDGKLGSDANTGASGSPFKTIYHALSVLPSGSAGQAAGNTVAIVGYTDYVYREAATSGLTLSGTSGSPLVIQSSNGVPVIVDGAATVDTTTDPAVAWTNVSGTVWKTPWTNALSLQSTVLDYPNTERKERIWAHTNIAAATSTPLRRPVPATGAGHAITIADLQAAGFSYFLDRWSAQGAGICSTAPGGTLPTLGTLYVNLATAAGAPALPSTNPTALQIEVPAHSTFYIGDSWSYVQFNTLRAWHGDLGFALGQSCHHLTFTACDGRFNFCYGFGVSGGSGTDSHDLAFSQCAAAYNTIQAAKIENFSHTITFDVCDFGPNSLQDGLDLVGSGVHDVTLQNSTIHDGNTMPLYNRYDASTGKVVGVTAEDGAWNITIADNTFQNQSSGIVTYISGAAVKSHNTGAADVLHGGDFGLTIHDNTFLDEVHVTTDSGFAISCGAPGSADEAGCAILFVNNVVGSCDGGGTGLNGGAYFTYTMTGKTFSGTTAPAPPPVAPPPPSGVPAPVPMPGSGRVVTPTSDLRIAYIRDVITGGLIVRLLLSPQGDGAVVAGPARLAQDVIRWILTPRGQDPTNPTFGNPLYDILMRPSDADPAQTILSMVRMAEAAFLSAQQVAAAQGYLSTDEQVASFTDPQVDAIGPFGAGQSLTGQPVAPTAYRVSFQIVTRAQTFIPLTFPVPATT